MSGVLKSGGEPTISDVARLSGVSKKTVSRVINRSPMLNQETRLRIESVIAEIGYVPNPVARGLALRRNFVLGMIYDNPNAQMVLNFQEGVLDAIRPTDYALLIHPVDRHSPTLFNEIRSFAVHQKPAGVMLLPPLSENDLLADLLTELGCPYVRMGSADLDAPSRLVKSSDRQSMREATEYLIRLGHRSIALVKGPDGFRSSVERHMGWREAMLAHHMPYDDQHVAVAAIPSNSGKSAGGKLLDQPGMSYTAILASNDIMAAGVIHAARERGLNVPEDVSVVGFDDTSIAETTWPPLTTVRWPIRDMARSAALKLIRPEAAGEEQYSFPTTLVERESTAPAKPRA